jgi:hypothetical protein
MEALYNSPLGTLIFTCLAILIGMLIVGFYYLFLTTLNYLARMLTQSEVHDAECTCSTCLVEYFNNLEHHHHVASLLKTA